MLNSATIAAVGRAGIRPRQAAMTAVAKPPTPPKAARFSVAETLRDGRPVEIRAQKPTDIEGLRAAVAHTSAETLSRRFFAPKRHFSEQEVAYFLNIDFVTQVALVAVVDEGGKHSIVAGGRYVLAQPGVAEVAFAVVDDYQGQGLGGTLMRHLVEHCPRSRAARAGRGSSAGQSIDAERVSEGADYRSRRAATAGAVHVTMQLT